MDTSTLGRRGFLRTAAAAALALALPLRRGEARAAGVLRIGVVLPPADPALAGAGLGRREAEHAARLFDAAIDVREHAAASAAAAADAARRLIADGVHVIVGGGTPAAADAVMELAEDAGVLLLNVGCAAESLRTPCGAFTFHVMPSEAMRRDALAAAAEAPAGARALAWHPNLSRFGAAQVNDRFRAAYGRAMTERAWTGWFAVKVAFEAAQRAGTTDPQVLATRLTSDRMLFDGHKGFQLSFRPRTHQLRQPLCILLGDDVLAEVPSGRVPPGTTHAQLLDTLGSGGESCTG